MYKWRVHVWPPVQLLAKTGRPITKTPYVILYCLSFKIIFCIFIFCDLEYQDGGNELQNLITEITAMRDPGLFISVMSADFLQLTRF